MRIGNAFPSILCGLIAGLASVEAATKLQKEPPAAWELLPEADGAFPLLSLARELQHLQLSELARLDEAERLQRVEFFTAIVADDRPRVYALLNAGFDPNTPLPSPPPPEVLSMVKDELLSYYVARETGVTALMIASVLGHHTMVKVLMIAGADPWKKTGKHKTFALWLAGRKQNVEIMQTLLGITADSEARQYRITVDLPLQQATLWKDGKAELVTPISSGRQGHATPTGHYLVTNKYKNWRSTLYPAQMPNFLRLSCGDFGFHTGRLPGYPASHGCIRLPDENAKKLYATVPIGTIVEIR